MKFNNNSWKTYPCLMVDNNSTIEELEMEEKRIEAIPDIDERLKQSLLLELRSHKVAIKDLSNQPL
jgi:hypothetical protein